MTVTVAKMNNRIVEVIRVADRVAFSDERGWVCISFHVADVNSNSVRWVRISDQHFEWIRDFHFDAQID